MTNAAMLVAAMTSFVTVLGACSNSSFSGTSSSNGSGAGGSGTGTGIDPASQSPGTDPTSATSPDPTSTPSGPCVAGDKVTFQWSGDVKTCIDQHMTYNFDTHQCAAMRPAQFSCDWPSVTAELHKRGQSPSKPDGLLTAMVKGASQAGAKLVSCGESQDGNRIVVQWIAQTDAVSSSCSYDPSTNHITTGCYTLYMGAPPPLATTQAEQQQQVFACMNQL